MAWNEITPYSNVVEIRQWQMAHLCVTCGEELENPVTHYWGSPCPYCGAVGDLCPTTVKTAKRYIVTYVPTFLERVFKRKKEEGHYEWQKIDKEDIKDGSSLTQSLIISKGRRLSLSPIMLGAAGIATGLF